MHRHDINAYSEGFSMWNWTIRLIKINTLNITTSICAVVWNEFTCIRTVAFLNTWSNDWTQELCSRREGFDWYGIWNKADIFVLVILQNKSSLQNYLWGTFRNLWMFFGVRGFSGRRTSRCETTGLTWSNLDRIY